MENQQPQQFIPPILTNSPEPLQEKPKKSLWIKIILGILGVLIIGVGYFTFKYSIQEKQIAYLETSSSAEYKGYVESINKISDEWTVVETRMKAQGSSIQDIESAKREFLEFIASTILLKIKLEKTTMSEAEKSGIVKKLAQLTSEMKIDPSVDVGCEYTEQELPLQDFFIGATLKFKKPMLYIDWKEEKAKYCSPSFAVAKYASLESASQWNSTIFDKEGRGIKDYKIDPSVTFTVEGRIRLHSRGLFNERDIDYYILKDSNGVISVVPYFYIFDQYNKEDTIDDGESGAGLYKNGKYIGYVVSDIRSGGVWVHGTQIPKVVVEANTPKLPTKFETPISKRDEFIRRVMFALEEGKIINYTNKELVDNDLGKDLYTYNNGEVVNNYGGKVYMKKVGNMLSLIFEKIQKGEDCYFFYWMNDPEIWGFKSTYIDGVLEEYNLAGSTNWNPIYEAFKQKVCYSGKENVTIEFKGDINEIIKKAEYRKKSEMPRY
ncbi:MAG: hypothetical protein WAW92_03375 [Minisyncoccia bacterium]